MSTASAAKPKSRHRSLTSVGGLLAAFVLSFVTMLAMPSSAQERWTRFASDTFQHIATETTAEIRNPTSLVQDHEGFLWIGTQDGLARWDGYRFRLYQPNAKQKNSLPDNDIRGLFVDHDGRLWIATSVGGLARYDTASDTFVTYTAGPKGLSHVTVTSLAEDGQGGLWVGTWGGLDHLDPRTGLIRKAVDTGLASEKIGALLRDASGALWIGTASGLARRDAQGTQTVILPTSDGSVPIIRQIYQDSRGHIWVGTRRHGAYLVDTVTRKARLITGNGGAGDLSGEGINTIVEAQPGEIWFGTFAHGIVVVDVATLEARRIVHDPVVSNSLLFDQVWSLYRDRSGLIWVATGQGLSRYAPEQGAFSVLPGATGRPNDMSEAGALAIHEMPDGRYWMGLTRKGVDIVDPVKGRLKSLVSDTAHPETALPASYVWDFAAIGARVYIATAQGLYDSRKAGNGVKRVHIAGRDPSAYTTALLPDDGRLWIAGYDGVWRIDPVAADVKPEHIEGLTDERARVLVKAPDGALWIGTENGLNRLTPDGKIERISPDRAAPAGLNGGYIASMLIDRRGRLWVGTSDGGINILTGRDASGRPRFHHIGTDDGLPNPNVDKLLMDRSGRIWAATDSGLAVIDANTFDTRAVGRESGLSILNYWVGAGTPTSAGELIFSGSSGVLVVRPDRLHDWTYTPPLVISDIHVGKTVKIAGPMNSGASQMPVVVPPGQAISIEFAALDLSAPERNLYRYRLDGFDRDWNETDADHRVATYTNLAPGIYTLRLQGSNRDGVWSPKTLTLRIRVLPAWFQSWWFRSLAAVALIAVVLLVVHIRTQVLRRRQRHLEALVEARTSELRKSQQQLEHLACFDALTGLPNRRMFHDDLRKAIGRSRRENSGFSLLLIDLDRFKQVNDTLGHDAGDALLQEAAIRLRLVLREHDCVARLGGDEFAILLVGDADGVDTDKVCLRIVESFLPPVRFQAHSLETSPSIGVASFPQDGDSEDSLYKSADVALYMAKRAGRNTWRKYAAEEEPQRAEA